MPGVLNLTDIFQLVIDRFDQCPLAEQEFVPQLHEPIFHVPADFRQQLKPLPPQRVVQRLGDIPPLSTALAKSGMAVRSTSEHTGKRKPP
jgi:hypothetical protein